MGLLKISKLKFVLAKLIKTEQPLQQPNWKYRLKSYLKHPDLNVHKNNKESFKSEV